MPSIALAVCTLDRPESLRRCLESVGRQTRLPDEVVVVDASLESSGKASVPGLRAARWIRSEPGLTRQRNLALDSTECDLIVFVDDDVELEPGYLAEIEAAFGPDDVVAATGRVLNPPAPGGPVRALLADLFLIASTGSGRFRRSTFATIACEGPARDVECLYGCNMALRREPAARLRFDEKLTGFGYCEDDDIARRLGRLGRLRFVPAATLWHRTQRQIGRDDPALYASLVGNAWYLRRKNWPTSRLTDIAFTWACLGLLFRYLAERRLTAARGVLTGVEHLVLRRPDALASHPG